MLGTFTWTEFGAVLVISLVLYYLFIGAKYYREEIKNLINGKLPKKDKTGQRNSESAPEDYSGTHSIEELDAVVNDLRYAILERAGKQSSKPELLDQLRARLANYTGLRKPAFRVAINNFLIQHAEDTCGIVFSEDELNSVWDTLSR